MARQFYGGPAAVTTHAQALPALQPGGATAWPAAQQPGQPAGHHWAGVVPAAASGALIFWVTLPVMYAPTMPRVASV